MATPKREKFSSQVDPELLTQIRKIASDDGRQFQAVLEDAIRVYIEGRSQRKVRPEVMAHFQASMEKNHRLLELFAK